MIASAANGFMNTNPFTAPARRSTSSPTYSSARAQNIIPWGIGPYMINNQFEIGHFEPCTTVRGRATNALGGDQRHLLQPVPRPVRDREGHLERASSRTTHRATGPGTPTAVPAAPNLVTGCDVFFDAIGDLDYDGTSYRADWPNSTTAGPFPTPFLQQQPTTVGGSGYPQIQFVTDTSATEFNTDCDLTYGRGLRAAAQGPGPLLPVLDAGEGRRASACGSSAT